MGAPLAVVVTGVRWLDGRVEVSARRAAKAGADGEIYSYDAVTVGASLRGTILRLDDDGAKLRLGRDVSGRVPVLHLSDKPLARPQQRLKKGQPLDCLVLQCDPAKKLVRLSAKTELLGSPLPRIATYADATAGVESHGVVIAVREGAVAVAFLGGVVGRVRGSEIRATLGAVWEASPRSCYREGQVVRCRVVRCDAPQRRLVLSFLTADQAAARYRPSALAAALPAGAKPAGAALSLRVGTTVDDGATIAAATADGLWVSLGDSSYGWLPYPHLTDSAAAAPLWRDAAARCVGAPLPPLLVLMVQPKAFGGAGRVTLSAKPSLRAAAAAAALPASASDVAVGRRVVGWVAKLKAEGAYIGFLGGLTGFCAVAHLSDAAAPHAAPLLAVGQTVAVSVRECEPAKLSDGRTILLSLQPSAVGAAAAALPPDAAAPPGGAIRGLETPMVAAEYDDRWRLASARAAADETEVVVGSADDEAAEAAAAPAAAAAAALHSRSPTTRRRRARRRRRTRRARPSTSPSRAPTAQRVRLRTADGAAAVASAEHLGRRRPKRGAAVRAIVLDADPLSGTLAVSLDDALVAAADGATPKGKRKRGSADGVEALRKGGATVTAVVQASTPQRLILSLPDHGHAIAIATPPPLGWNLAGAAAAAAAAPRFEVGASVRCVTLKSPAPSEVAGGLAPRAAAGSAAAAALCAARGRC